MATLVSLLIAVCKAVPALASLLHAVSDGLRAVQAGHRLDEKDAAVDAAVALALRRMRDDKILEREKANEQARLRDGGSSGPGVGDGKSENDQPP